MKQVCDRHGALYVLDEVMSGMGRTGTLHAWEQEGVVPHLQTVAKGLGAGYSPIGALLLGEKVVDVVTHGTGSFVHSQTYQGHPIACAASNEVQRIIRDEDLLQNVRERGAELEKLLRQRLADHKNVGDIRGRGLFWGVSLLPCFCPLLVFSPTSAYQVRNAMNLTLPFLIHIGRTCQRQGNKRALPHHRAVDG
jgi:adenosylmethionine-8-amino-7-oxononanoate aminotransferase